MSDQPPVRLRRPRVRVGDPQRACRARARGRPTRCSPPPRRSRRATRSTTRSRRRRPLRLPGLQGPAAAAPYDVLRRTPATTRRRWTWRGRSYMSSNTYFLALEDALGSVEGPVRMAERMGMNFDARQPVPRPTRSSPRTAARSPSAPTRPARSTWPAPTRRSARQRHPVRPDAGRRRSSTAPASRSTDDDGAAGRDGRQLHAGRDPGRRRQHAEPDPAQGRRAGLRRPDRLPGVRSPATRSPARPGRSQRQRLRRLRRLHARSTRPA